jgi:hypothetical protein
MEPLQRRAELLCIEAIASTLQTLGSVPSGELYAILQSYMELETYRRLLGALKAAGYIREENNQIVWQEPSTRPELPGKSPISGR